MALTATFIKRAKQTGKATGDKHADGCSLYLLVKAAGKYWRWGYTHAGTTSKAAHVQYRVRAFSVPL